jgi:hypothetical protein
VANVLAVIVGGVGLLGILWSTKWSETCEPSHCAVIRCKPIDAR